MNMQDQWNATPSSSMQANSTLGSQPSQPVQQKSGKGCLFYGCLTVLIIGVLSIAVIFFAVRAFVMKVTEDKPLALPVVTITQEESQQALSKLRAFEQKLNGNAPTEGEVLTLNERELNSLLLAVKDLEALRDSLRVHIKGSTLGLEYSQSLVPMGMSGRYVNMLAEVDASVDRGILHILIRELKVAGSSFAEGIVKSQSADADIGPQITGKYPNVQRLVSKIERAEVKDGVVRIELRKQGT